MKQEGIFRVNGNAKVMEKLKLEFDKSTGMQSLNCMFHDTVTYNPGKNYCGQRVCF